MKWEYRVLTVFQRERENIENFLNVGGRDGWELVAFTPEFAVMAKKVAVTLIANKVTPRQEKEPA